MSNGNSVHGNSADDALAVVEGGDGGNSAINGGPELLLSIKDGEMGLVNVLVNVVM